MSKKQPDDLRQLAIPTTTAGVRIRLMEPAPRFRWVRKSRFPWMQPKLQQAHVCKEDGSVHWCDVPTEFE